MEYRQLGNTDMKVSALSFGASSLGGVFVEVDEAECIRTVHTTIDRGINFIDVSPFYGDTRAETVLGKALKTVPRDKYFLATKTGRFGDGSFDYSPKRIRKSLDESLKRLRVDYLDVFQLHDIEYEGARHLNVIINESIPYLMELKQQGVIRYFGITSYPVSIFGEVHEQCKVDTMLCHCHYMLSDTSMLELLPYAQNDGVGLIAASPLGMGLLTERGVPDWHTATPEDMNCVKRAVTFCKEQGTSLEKLALQFGVANPDIPTNLVSSSKVARMIENIIIVEQPIDHELVKEVQRLLEPIKNKDFNFSGS